MFALFLGQNKSTSEQYAAVQRQSVHPFWPVNSPIDPRWKTQISPVLGLPRTTCKRNSLPSKQPSIQLPFTSRQVKQQTMDLPSPHLQTNHQQTMGLPINVPDESNQPTHHPPANQSPTPRVNPPTHQTQQTMDLPMHLSPESTQPPSTSKPCTYPTGQRTH